MKIKCFETIDARTFLDWAWPVDGLSPLPEFADYNLIYGWNGSGKTTLSDILSLIEKRQFLPPSSEGIRSFRVDWEGGSSGCALVTEQNITTPLQRLPAIRVFNRQYIDDAVYRSDNKGLAPIKIVVGDEAVKLKKEADSREAVLKTENDRLAELRANLKNASNAFDKFCTEKAKSIKDILPKIGKYGNYNKGHYKACCDELLKATTAQNFVLDEKDRQARKMLAFSSVKDALPSFSYVPPALTSLLSDVTALRRHIVAAKIIQTLAERADVAHWVEQGLQLHKKHNSASCLYCELPIPPERTQDIEKHFSKEYELFTNRLRAIRTQIESNLQTLRDTNLPARAEFYDDLHERYNLIGTDFDAFKKQVTVYLEGLLGLVDEKASKPFDNLTTEVASPQFSTSPLNDIKKLIEEHNKRTSEFQSQINAACEAIEKHIVADSLPEYQKKLEEINALNSGVGNLETKCKQEETEIERLHQQISSHKIPADLMNQDLKSYLGHAELQLVAENDGYKIMRGQSEATALSEGEKSAIAIIHFLRSLQSAAFDLKNGIVVIDDPVSSMDENALYHAYSFIKSLAENASQLIILTHNFPFFGLIKNWFFYATRKDRGNKTVHFYHARASLFKGVKSSIIEELPRLLTSHESEYHYLFSKVVEKSRDPNNSDLEASYSMPNVARRLLESFLAFRFPSPEAQKGQKGNWSRSPDNMRQRLEKLLTQLGGNFTDRIKKVDKFINIYSHGLTVGQTAHDPTILSETKSILVAILEIIQAADEGHYNGMMETVGHHQPINSSPIPTAAQPIKTTAPETTDA